VITPKQLVKLYKKHGSLKAVARAEGLHYIQVHRVYVKAQKAGIMGTLRMGRKTKVDQLAPKVKQRVKALRTKRMVPKKGTINRFILTSAQNNTNVHDKTWTNLLALVKHYEATLLVSPFLYHKIGLGARNDKAQLPPKRKVEDRSEIWYDPKLIPYICNRRVEIASGLVFCGELQILPTAVKPLSGLEVYTGRKSMIAPHTKQEMQSIAHLGGDGTKFNYCTGTVTQRNYIQSKAGFKAEFHHMYGGLLVEIDENGDWYVRQLNADSDGTIYDWDLCAADGEVTDGHRVEAVEPGDIHCRRLKKSVKECLWGEGGVMDELNPREQHINDLLDFHTRGHHDIKDVFKMFERHVEKRESVKDEVVEARVFLQDIKRPDCLTVVKDSNHDRHIYTWLAQTDGRKDPINAEYWTRLNSLIFEKLRDGKKFILLEEAMRLDVGPNWNDATFIDCNTSHVICKKFGGGIECAMHGDLPYRAGLATFSKMGRRSNTAHGHTCAIVGGAFRAGKSCEDQMGYNDGASAWSDTFILTYPNSKRTLVTIRKGRARA